MNNGANEISHSIFLNLKNNFLNDAYNIMNNKIGSNLFFNVRTKIHENISEELYVDIVQNFIKEISK